MAQSSSAESANRGEQSAPVVSSRSLLWVQDWADYSWLAVDDLGYFYRVTKVMTSQFKYLFACGWTETFGFRQSPTLYTTLAEAKSRMDHIAAFKEGNSLPEDRS